MKIDARTKYSLMVIKETFIKLLKENPVNKITVKRLCDEAEINRATFYRYYEDIFDLYDKVKEEFIDDYFISFPKCNMDSIEKDIKVFLDEVKRNSDIVYAFAKQDDAITFMRVVCERIYFRFGEYLTELCPGLNERQKKIAYCYLVCGCSGTMGEWIMNDFKDDTEEMAAMLTRLIKNTLKNL